MSTSSPPPPPPPSPANRAPSGAAPTGPRATAATSAAPAAPAPAKAASRSATSRFGRRKSGAEPKDKAKAPRVSKPSGNVEARSGLNPIIPAIIAGLLALAGAFLLVTSLNGADAEDAADTATATVLVVKAPIAQGTTVSELVEQRATLLTAKVVPERYAAATALSSIAELTELGDKMLASDISPGEQLLRGRFIDRNDFERDSYIDRSIAVEVPPGHHQVVLEIDASRALGGNVRPGDVVTVLSGFRVKPIEADGTTRPAVETSLVVLNAVEVLNVQTAGLVGELAVDAETVGIAATGDLVVTLAVTPDEITDLTYAIEFGDIILAVAVDEVRDSEERPITLMESILTGDDLILDGDVPGLIRGGGTSAGAADDQQDDGADEEVEA